MCNPLENQSPSIFEAAESPEMKRRMIELRLVGPQSQYFPGNFAFLRSPALGPGADALRNALARTNPGTCFTQDGVDTQTGQNVGPVHQGLNVRFDIYDGPMSGRRNNADFRPSMNVRKGYGGTGGACSKSLIDDGVNYQGLPRDQTVQAELGGGRLYSGDWDFENYWAVNYGHAGITAPNGWNNTNRPSRYEVYRYEIDNPMLLNPPYLNRQSVGGEIGAPICSNSTPTDVIDRRILYGAVVNCAEEGPLQGYEEGVPVLTFARFFLIRPLDGSDSIDVELVGLTQPGLDDEVVRDQVQLYR
jgi:hypothetical protein